MAKKTKNQLRINENNVASGAGQEEICTKQKFDAELFVKPFFNRSYDNMIFEWHQAQMLQAILHEVDKQQLCGGKIAAVLKEIEAGYNPSAFSQIAGGYEALYEAREDLYGEQNPYDDDIEQND